MSDLQCPARVVLVPDVEGAGSAAGAVSDLVAALRAARVVRVYAGPAVLASAVALAERLGVPVELRVDLADVSAEGAVPPALDQLADRHLGEAIAVVADTGEVLELERDTVGWAPVRRVERD